MSREQQIERMARVLNECCNEYDENGRRLRNKCFCCEYWCHTNHVCCSYGSKEATALYEAGYRLATDVAREIFADIEKILKTEYWFVEECKEKAPDHDAYCALDGQLCGLDVAMSSLCELKKKYFGDSNE